MEINILEGQILWFKEGNIIVHPANIYIDEVRIQREKGTDAEVFTKVMNKGKLVDFLENRG